MIVHKILLFLIFLVLAVSCKDKVEVVPEVTIEKSSLDSLKMNKITSHKIDSLSFLSIKDSLLYLFYKENQFKTFWVSDQSRGALLNTLGNVEDEGLFKKHFDIDSIQKMEMSIETLSEDKLIAYDFLLTENLLRYIYKVSKGSIDPKKMYQDHDLVENAYDFERILLDFRDNDFEKAIEALKPQHIVYKKLRTALKLLDSYPKKTFIPIDVKEKIELNDTLDVVVAIKERLIFWNDLNPSDSISPVFDKETQLAVQKFQMRHGLAPDGVIGAGTIHALNVNPQQRKEQIIANMERWRWYPRNMGKQYLIINIPDYTLHAVQDQDTSRTHKVIVGLASRKTPVLSSKLSHLVFNPTWTIPPTIKKNDVIPAITKDRGYLASKNMTVYDKEGKKVKPEDWNQKEALSYRYVQSPGQSNSLGLVKFMFPNRFSVYLHDTNSRSFFDRANRSLSSGCVRVQNPFELAAYLLDDKKKWPLETIYELVKNHSTKEAQLTKEIYIHLLYWTAWSEGNTLQFRDDMYNRDANLYKALLN